ncbi:MAG: hypothetical protein PHO58_05320 [Bacilli bacterium]|nr:hypothetical protein [Bacilli bacterium]
MKKKNSMYFNDYEVGDYISKADNTLEANNNLCLYIDSLVDELTKLGKYIYNTEPDINVFYEVQDRLISFKNKLNAETLADWHVNYTYDLERKVAELNR